MANQYNKEFILALGGGGGRGLAHLGVLKALEEHQLKPAAIVGTSIGALFGSMYALYNDIDSVISRVTQILTSDAFKHLKIPHLVDADTADHTWLGKITAAARQSVLYAHAATGTSLTDTTALKDIVEHLCESKTFADLHFPVFMTSVRFPSGEIEIFSSGNLTQALIASMAIPGVFEPVNIDGQDFVDGGVACELPAREAQIMANPQQLVVAVDVGTRPNPELKPATVIGMLDWSVHIKSMYLRQYKADCADILIEPMPGFRQWSDFTHADQEIERGREVALQKIPDLIELMKN